MVDDVVRAAAELSDEEYGIEWAEQNNKRPKAFDLKYFWSTPVTTRDYHLPPILFNALSGGMVESMYNLIYLTRTEAYAALGHAVREVHRQVPHLDRPPTPADKIQLPIGWCSESTGPLNQMPQDTALVQFVERCMNAGRFWETEQHLNVRDAFASWEKKRDKLAAQLLSRLRKQSGEKT